MTCHLINQPELSTPDSILYLESMFVMYLLQSL